jgi:putative restriction endonuclease
MHLAPSPTRSGGYSRTIRPVPGVADYLDITPGQARAQWRQVVARPPRPTTPGFRQAPFTPVETLLSLAGMLLVNHRHYGGSTSHAAPSPVPELAALTRRTPASILAKMANLDGSRPNGARHEVETAATLLADSAHLAAVYSVVIDAARAEGVGPELLPDFLHLEEARDLLLLGQDELEGENVEAAIEPQLRTLAGQMGDAPEQLTERLLVAAARVGQHRFAADVLTNFAHRCGFCGLRPGPALERKGLLVASHIKPWRVSSNRERLDAANGIAACPTHDKAFDAGLLWVNGGHRIHAVEALDAAARDDPGMAASFGRPPLVGQLLVPDGARPPGAAYLAWHRDHVIAA